MKALLIIDMQYDFLPEGKLAVKDGNSIISVINKSQSEYQLVVATQDWHPENHKSFAANHPGKKVFEEINLNGLSQTLWPKHCVQGTVGAEITKELDQERIEAIFRKGMDKDIDSYSGFYDNGRLKSTGLGDYLKGRNVTQVDVCGLAADYCVYFSASDALSMGFKTSIIERATKAIDIDNFEKLKKEFVAKGGKIV